MALLATLALAGGVAAQEKKTAPKKPAAPAKPTTPAAPTPAPAKPGGAAPAPRPTDPALDEKRRAMMLRELDQVQKSDKAGIAFRKFLEAKTVEERLPLVLDRAKHEAAVKKYFAESPNREYRILAVNILGSVTPPSQPGTTIFPYFVATDKNPMGFITAVVETKDGFKLDWPTFSTGHDSQLEKFISDKPATAQKFLVGIARTHIFGGPPNADATYYGFSIAMPPAPLDKDMPTIFVEKNSEIGKELGAKLGWAKGHLCYLTLKFDGSEPNVLRATAYEPYTK